MICFELYLRIKYKNYFAKSVFFSPFLWGGGKKRQIIFVQPVLSSVIALGNHSKLVATISLPKSPTLLDNFCKDVNIIHLSSEIIFGQLL